LPVGEKPILQRAIEHVTAAGIEQIGLVIGFHAEMIRDFVKKQFPSLRIRFMVNPKFESTNNAFSLLMAREFFNAESKKNKPLHDLLLMDADIVFSPHLLPFLLNEGSPNRIAMRVAGHHDEEEVRVQVDALGNVLVIGKTTPLADAFGESLGIEFFSSLAAQRLFEILEQRVRAGEGRHEFYEATFQAMIDQGIRFKAVDVSSFPAIEIDTPEDLFAAEALVLRSTAIRNNLDEDPGPPLLTYDYKKSVKSSLSDELINTYLLRPLAGLVVRVFYRTPITPNHVTFASTIAGLVAASLYLKGDAFLTAIAGLCVTLKDILDSADGQLARAKQQYSRRGRFLDSLGDFVVDVAVFGALGWVLYASSGDWRMIVLSILGLFGITLRVSYHVFYQTSFLHLEQKYEVNRITENITTNDLTGDLVALRLQKAFQLIYGWQDRLMLRVDTWCRHGRADREFLIHWYSHPMGLRLSGLVGFGTELFLLMVCSLFNALALYLVLNVFFMSGIVLVSVLYRRWYLSATLPLKGQS